MIRTLFLLALSLWGCRKSDGNPGALPAVGLVTDVGGRGDGSFNDSALRGLETWAAGLRHAQGTYQKLSMDEWKKLVPAELTSVAAPLGIRPLVVQSKSQEDYEPNLQLLVDQGAQLVVGVGFMLENAVEQVARRNPQARFLLIDSPLLDASGRPQALPNVRTVVFKEEEGSFLAGALAGQVARKQVAFIGGMDIPLIRKFEAGFRAGVQTAHAGLGSTLLTAYTGSFDNVAAGKAVAQDLLSKGVDVLFHAAGSDGLGVIQAVKEARAAGRNVWVMGVDSDQWALAPGAVLTSMVKRVDLAVYESAKALQGKNFEARHVALGLRENAVVLAEVRLDFPDKEAVLAKVEALRKRIVQGELVVPSTLQALANFK